MLGLLIVAGSFAVIWLGHTFLIGPASHRRAVRQLRRDLRAFELAEEHGRVGAPARFRPRGL